MNFNFKGKWNIFLILNTLIWKKFFIKLMDFLKLSEISKNLENHGDVQYFGKFVQILIFIKIFGI